MFYFLKKVAFSRDMNLTKKSLCFAGDLGTMGILINLRNFFKFTANDH